jgi:hypothetical protein
VSAEIKVKVSFWWSWPDKKKIAKNREFSIKKTHQIFFHFWRFWWTFLLASIVVYRRVYILLCCGWGWGGSLVRHSCPAVLPGSLARQSCPAVLPVSLARQSCPAVLPGSLARQSCPAVLPGSLVRQFCPAVLPGSLARQSCPAVLPGSLARQSCPAVLPGSLARQSCPAVLSGSLARHSCPFGPSKIRQAFRKQRELKVSWRSCMIVILEKVWS